MGRPIGWEVMTGAAVMERGGRQGIRVRISSVLRFTHTRALVTRAGVVCTRSRSQVRPVGQVVSLQHTSTQTPKEASQKLDAHSLLAAQAAPAGRLCWPATSGKHMGTVSDICQAQMSGVVPASALSMQNMP